MVFLARSCRFRSSFLLTICCTSLYLLLKQNFSFPTMKLSSAHQTACQRRYPLVNPSDICTTFLMPARQLYFIALNLYNNDLIMPTLQTEILRLVFALRTCTTVAQQVFVSIYESGSTDGTAAALEQFNFVLNYFEVPHKIVTRGRWTREAIKPRIQHLAKIRNAVLQPLYDQPYNTYTQIIFLNDILFCVEDVLTLIQSQVSTLIFFVLSYC